MNEDVVEQEGDVVGGGVWAGRDVREGGGMGEGVGGGGGVRVEKTSLV